MYHEFLINYLLVPLLEENYCFQHLLHVHLYSYVIVSKFIKESTCANSNMIRKFINLETSSSKNKKGWPGGIGGLFHFAEAKHPASPSAHLPAAAERRAPLAELVFQ